MATGCCLMGRGWMRELLAGLRVKGEALAIEAAATARGAAANAEIGLMMGWLLGGGSAPNLAALPVALFLVVVALPFPLRAFAVVLTFSDFVVTVDSKVSLASVSLMSLAKMISLGLLGRSLFHWWYHRFVIAVRCGLLFDFGLCPTGCNSRVI